MSLTRSESAPQTDRPGSFGSSADGETHRFSLSAILAGMSRALDLAEGHPAGHALRTCVLGMRFGRAAGLADEQLADLYHALLLKDAGGSTTAARIATLFAADDQVVKPRMKLADHEDRWALAREAWRSTGRQASLGARLRCVATVLRPELSRSLVSLRSERAAAVAERLGLSQGTMFAIRSLNEHWNGKGSPAGLQDEAIPLLSRIMHLAQITDLVLLRDGAEAAEAMLRARRGRWFDPALADAAREMLRDDVLRRALLAPDIGEQVLSAEPASGTKWIDDEGVDEIAHTFADIIDAKSVYLEGHSPQVAHSARAIGQRLGFDAETLRQLSRAGLLHDVGMLGVSSRILEKVGPLNVRERTEIEQHPVQTWEVLRHVPAFSDIAMLASMHHEKLDGSGYPWRKVDEDLDPPVRTLAVAVVFHAAMGNRAFRSGLTVSEALSILDAQRGLRLAGEAIDALAATVESGEVGAP